MIVSLNRTNKDINLLTWFRIFYRKLGKDMFAPGSKFMLFCNTDFTLHLQSLRTLPKLPPSSLRPNVKYTTFLFDLVSFFTALHDHIHRIGYIFFTPHRGEQNLSMSSLTTNCKRIDLHDAVTNQTLFTFNTLGIVFRLSCKVDQFDPPGGLNC